MNFWPCNNVDCRPLNMIMNSVVLRLSTTVYAEAYTNVTTMVDNGDTNGL